jgi:hypothetical protein
MRMWTSGWYLKLHGQEAELQGLGAPKGILVPSPFVLLVVSVVMNVDVLVFGPCLHPNRL